MAKGRLTSFLHSISGSVGNNIYSTGPGGVVEIRNKVMSKRDARSDIQLDVRSIIREINVRWKHKPLRERMLWGMYAREFSLSGRRIGTLMRRFSSVSSGRHLSGAHLYCGLNQMLLTSGLNWLERPPRIDIHTPPSPLVDLIQYGTYKGSVKFRIWLSSTYLVSGLPIPTVAQIMLSVRTFYSSTYLVRPCPSISATPIDVAISTVRLRSKLEGNFFITEVPLSELTHPILHLQFRTVAQNGTFSMPSAHYIVEVV
ncbi:MAG: hypothetical protein HY769_10500 [Candidatus Stahlbacteria bacterium]|nr:hypothetical protein [Candidatus Stahlbacteria bacterium]